MNAPPHWVFAYGSNMHLPDLVGWLKRHHPLVSLPMQFIAAELPGFELVWNYWSPVRQGGAANVQRSEKDRTLYGALLQVDSGTLEALDQKEGHPTRYSRFPAPVSCRSLDGQLDLEAWIYQVSNEYRSDTPIFPTASYLKLLTDGAEALKLPSPYLHWLSQTSIAF